MTKLLLDDYVRETSGDYFECLSDKKYSIAEITQLFRREYELFRGEPIDFKVVTEGSIGQGVLSERSVGQISIIPLGSISSSEGFRVVAWNTDGNDGKLRRFYNSLEKKFE